MNLFITGGTGTIGRELTRQFYPIADRIVIYSRDEAKHAEMNKEFPEYPDNKMRYFIGDICDYDRLVTAMKGCDTVIHAAAMKHIDKCEYNPTESVRVNVLGSLNVARACSENHVDDAIFISTDKACLPLSAYGAQKSTVEHLWTGYNNLTFNTRYNIVRYGNVWCSKGSVFNTWEQLAKEGKPISVTAEDMTRFFWLVEDAASFIYQLVPDIWINRYRGCIFVPKMNKFRLIDIARTYSDNIQITGLRCPEKTHEDLISVTEGRTTYDNGFYYTIAPQCHDWSDNLKIEGERVPAGFKLSSEVI